MSLLKMSYNRIRQLMQGKYAIYFKYILAIIPFVWIVQRIDFNKLITAFRSTELWVIPSMTIFALLLMFLQGIKWWMLLRAFIPHLPLSEVLSCHFKGIYYSMFLPTSAAQDVVRSALLSRNNDYGVSWGSTWLARISGLTVMLLLSLYGVITIDPAHAPKGMTAIVGGAWGALLIVGFMSFSKRLTRVFNILLSKVMPKKIIETIEHIREGVYRYRHKGRCLLSVMMITVVIQVLFVLNAIFIIRGVTGKFYVNECFMYIPLIEIICLSLPLTPNGIGIRDGLSALMFHQIGLSIEQLGTYVLISLGTVVLKIVGGVPIVYDAITGKRVKDNNEDVKTGR
jgi:glycosyltransferase 2 family protein